MADSAQEIVIANEAPAPVVAAASPMELLSRALERGADLAMVEKLMDLAERQERNLAKKAFDAAVAEAKKGLPVIKTNREGNNKKRYADLAAFAAVVDPVLGDHGLSYRYRAEQTAALITVTCVLSHCDGYSEETTLSSAPDTSGNKNSIQAIGSALTYLQRYALKLALGLAASEDDDGKSADGDEPVSAEQLEEIRSKIEASGADIEAFCRYLKVEALPDIRKSQYPAALAAIAQKMKAKKQGGGK
jgi:hypothetical protein